MIKTTEWAQAFGHLRTTGPIYIAGCCGEPTRALDAIAAMPDLFRGRTFTGVWIPGVNRRDPTDGIPGARAETAFVTPSLTDGIAEGRIDVFPLHYSEIWKRLSSGLPGWPPVAGGIAHVSRPKNGDVTFGISSDFSQAVLASGAPMIGVINGNMPTPVHAEPIPVERFATLIEGEAPLIDSHTRPLTDDFKAIGRQIARLIRPGDTLQMGLGKVQTAVLAALQEVTGLDDLGFHSGLITPGLLPLLDQGVFTKGVVTGAALGDSAFYPRAAAHPAITYRPVGHTHAHATLAAIEKLTTINSVLEVDLYGQANTEFVSGRQVTGHGGMVDFIRGAHASPGGRSILAMPATAKNGTQSRITVTLMRGHTATVGRADADYIVTEYGWASLRNLSVEARAKALITIAAPQFREQLAEGWSKLT